MKTQVKKKYKKRSILRGTCDCVVLQEVAVKDLVTKKSKFTLCSDKFSLLFILIQLTCIFQSRKTRLTVEAIRYANHATISTRNVGTNFAGSAVALVAIIRLRTNNHAGFLICLFACIFEYYSRLQCLSMQFQRVARFSVAV
jgi:hypothetical protein